MTSDGINSQDWDQLHNLAVQVANASGEEEDELRSQLLSYLQELESKYGELPSILATRADYAEDSRDSERLLLRAFDLAVAIADTTNVREIALSLADRYSTDLFDVPKASRWLAIAEPHIKSGSPEDREEYRGIERRLGN